MFEKLFLNCPLYAGREAHAVITNIPTYGIQHNFLWVVGSYSRSELKLIEHVKVGR